ncbi:MAG: hypothetical protein K2N57_05870 [Clostridia bacterium]|nr:hypothetical protein [Clostridia bacterium]
MKKKIAVAIILVMMLVMASTMFFGCEKEIVPRKVELELVNPNTGEAVQWDEVIDLPEEKTKIVVRIKDKETGEYLTDDDLPENTVEGSYHVNFIILDNEGHTYRQEYYKYWPTKEDIEDVPYYNYYEMWMFFDCRPKRPENPEKFQRRYERKSTSVYFYINKPWREGGDR